MYIATDLWECNLAKFIIDKSKLADFGIAKPLNPNTTQSTMNMNIQGTIVWIAPEVFSGTKDHVSILSNP